jgi:polyhydroxybutyrate depolymerase
MGALPDAGSTGTIHHGGIDRSYRLVGSLAGDTPPPLVVALHGGLQSVDALIRMSDLDVEAQRSGFAVVYPVGVERTWNAGRCCGAARHLGVDDVGFVIAVIDRLIAAGQADAARIYATGISNGGMLAYRLATEHAQRFAAIAPVAANMLNEGRPSHPVSVLHIHGTRDRMVPFGGGVGERSLTRVANPPVLEVIDRWCGYADATGAPTVEHQPPSTIETWLAPDGTEIALCTIEGGGHVWPGPHTPLRSTASAFDATPFILRFFARHVRAS